MGALPLRKPVNQFQEFWCGSSEALGLLLLLSITTAGNHYLLVNIQTSTTLIYDSHDTPLSGSMAGQIPALTRFCSTCSPPKGGDNRRFLQVSRSNCSSGSQHQRYFDLRPADSNGGYYSMNVQVNGKNDNIFIIVCERSS
jgi:hypothetical protein